MKKGGLEKIKSLFVEKAGGCMFSGEIRRGRGGSQSFRTAEKWHRKRQN